MTKFASFDEAMPCWVDVMVGTEEEHEASRAFLSALFDWTWQIGGAEMGSYSLAITQDLPVLGLGIMEGAHGTTTPYFSTSNIDDALARATDAGATVVVPRDAGRRSRLDGAASSTPWAPRSASGSRARFTDLA